MPTTPNLALPYPLIADTSDVPRDIGALADRLDILGPKMITGFVTTLPGSPYDGQEVLYQHTAGMEADGIVWHLRYRAASASAYKWECVGGAGMSHEIQTGEDCASSIFSDLATSGPWVTVPRSGEYEVSFGAKLVAAGAVHGFIAPKFGSTAENTYDEAEVTCVASGDSYTVSRTLPRRVIGGGAMVLLRYRRTGTTPNISRRVLTIRPIRIG